MKINYDLILRIISILSIGTSLFSFIVTTLITKTKSPKFIEYTDLPKFFLNFYVFLILLLCFLDSVYPNLICHTITHSFGIIKTIRGKIILSGLIDVMYYSTDNLPQKLFGMISFVSVLALLLGYLVLNCEILKQKAVEENSENNNNNNISDKNTSSNDSFSINKNNNI